jgi:hypothetical protein
MKTPARIAFVTLITLGCAVEANSPPGLDSVIPQGGSSSGGSGGGSSGGSSTSGSGSFSGSTSAAGTPSTAGTGTGGTFGEPVGGTFGNPTGGGGMGGTTAGSGGAGGSGGSGTAGKSSGGSAGTSTGGSGTAGTGGSPPTGPYCEGKTLSPLPYTVNDGFQPSGWQGDFAAISAANITPDGCAQRSANPVGACSAWRYTPNAVTPAWAGVSWSKVWDAQYTHPPVCIANGATKVTFQAKGAVGGEQIIASAAGAQEYPFTLTNAWAEYSISLAGVTYNSYAEGVASGFFWKVAPPTPAGGAVTFFIDDIKFEQ